jgi:hypothetical protein
MASGFCLPKVFVSKFVDALKKGDIDPEKLMDMSSADRRAFFEPIVGEENAEDVNALFESKMLLRDQKRGLLSWAKKVAGISEPARRDLVTRIEKLDRVLNPADEKGFLADLAAQKLGVTVTTEEAKKISDLAKAAVDAKARPTANLSGVNDEYLIAADDLKHYIASIKPTSPLGMIWRDAMVTARNFLLMNPSTPIKATESQIVNSAMDMVSRRIAYQSLGAANPELMGEAKAQAWQTFMATGKNTAAMEGLSDSGMLGERANFDVPEGMAESKIPGINAVVAAARTAAKWSTKVAIDWEHNITFTKFYQGTFFDMLNIASTNIAKSEGLEGEALKTRAGEIFADAARVEPESDIGATVRQLGQQQAARITSTNDNLLARLTMGLKNGLNNGIKGPRGDTLMSGIPGLGDILMPIAKIPATVISNGVENAGIGLPLGIKDIFQGRKLMQSADAIEATKGAAQFGYGLQRIVRTIGTLGAAAYFSSLLTPEDFRSDKFGAHFVKIGGVWINAEYISAISPALAGMMSVKASSSPGQGPLETVSQYFSGAAQGLRALPGIDEVGQLVNAITETDAAQGIRRYAQQFFDQRGQPAFLANLEKDRPINRLFFGAHGVETQEQIKADTEQQVQQRAANRLGTEKFGMNVWGEPSGVFGSPQNDPVSLELKRIGYAPSFPADKMSVKGVKDGVPLSNSQYREYVQISGRLAKQHITALLQLPGWQSFPLAWRAKEIQKTVEHDRKAAMAKMQMDSLGGPHDLIQAAVQAKRAAMSTLAPAGRASNVARFGVASPP